MCLRHAKPLHLDGPDVVQDSADDGTRCSAAYRSAARLRSSGYAAGNAANGGRRPTQNAAAYLAAFHGYAAGNAPLRIVRAGCCPGSRPSTARTATSTRRPAARAGRSIASVGTAGRTTRLPPSRRRRADSRGARLSRRRVTPCRWFPQPPAFYRGELRTRSDTWNSKLSDWLAAN